MVVEDLLERDQRVVGLLLENAVAIPREGFAEIRGPLLPELADPRPLHLLVMRDDRPPARHLPGDALRLVHEQHHDVEDRLLELRGLGRVGEIPAERDHFIEEHLQALDLHLRAREAIEHGAILLLGIEKLAKQDADDFPIAHHSALRLHLPRLGAVQKLADDDRRGGDVAQLANEIRICPLARAGSAAQQNQFFWKPEPIAPIIVLRVASRRC